MSSCCPPFNPLQPGFGNNLCVFQDGTPFFEDVEELRQFIIDREANRKLEDLVNVEAGIGTYDEGLLLGFDTTTQMWSIIEAWDPIVW